MRPYYSDEYATIYHGDCREVLPEVGMFRAVVTSPPYAEQRAGLYEGIPESEYPDFTWQWCKAAAGRLEPSGSIFINIREHVRDGQISDYVHRTRLHLRERGLNECDELIWVKSASPPVGHPARPRRSWERILWFSVGNQPAVHPKHNGTTSSRVGFIQPETHTAASWMSKASGTMKDGVARCPDYVEIPIAPHRGETGIDHPARYPVPLATWLVKLATKAGHTVCDPFMGSGTTLLAAKEINRKAVGIELEERYCEIAAQRLSQGVLDLGAA